MSDSIDVLRARLAAHAKWANADPVAGTAKARAAFLLKFIDQVDPDRSLPEPERLRRAEHARKAYFTRLAMRSAVARRKKAKEEVSEPGHPDEVAAR